MDYIVNLPQLKVSQVFPYILLMGVVLVATYHWGVQGFFTGLLVGYGSIAVIGWMVGYLSGGMVPKKVRDETVTDFMNAHPDVVHRVFENLTAYEAKIKIESLLDQMFRKANSDNTSIDVSRASTPEVLIPSAVSFSESQPTELLRYLCLLLLKYICGHPMWFKGMQISHILEEQGVDTKLKDIEPSASKVAGEECRHVREPKLVPGHKQVLEGADIAQDCYENGLMKGSPVYLSQIEELIKENYSYMPNAVLNGFLNRISGWVEAGELVVLNIEGGDQVFVHKDHVDELLDGD